MKIHLRPNDRLFTKIIRIRDDFTCQRCGTKYVFDGVAVRSLGNLGVSHFWGRSHEGTRFDFDNVILLCNFPCHTGENGWEGEKKSGGYYDYMVNKLGQAGFDLLELRAHTYSKRDDKMNKIMLTLMLQEIEEERRITKE